MIKLRFVHSILSQWKSKRILATHMRRMRNSNLEIRIAIKISTCRLEKRTLTFFSQSGTVLSEFERLRSRLDAVARDEVLPELLPDSMEIYSA